MQVPKNGHNKIAPRYMRALLQSPPPPHASEQHSMNKTELVLECNCFDYLPRVAHIPKTQKMLLDAALLNTQHYKVRINGKM